MLTTVLFDAWLIQFTDHRHPHCCPIRALWGVTESGDVVCARKPKIGEGDTIFTLDGIFKIQGELMYRDDVPRR